MNRKILFKYLSIIFSVLFSLESTVAQHLNQNLEFYSRQQINKQINQSDSIIHTGFKPLIVSGLYNKSISDSVSYFSERDKIFSNNFKSKWIYRKVRTEDFVLYQSKNFNLKANPLFFLSYKKGKEENQTFFKNTRGVEFKGDIGSKFSFYTSFYENQARFEPYITDYVKNTLVVPGQGAAKMPKNQDDKFDFSRSSAYFTLKFSPKFNIQAGHYKHFIGEGYRSLLLSDNSFNYPFIKFTITFNKFQYTLLWNQYQSFLGAYYNYHQRKYSSITYLSWVPKAGFEVALFESVMWPGNTPEKNNNFNFEFFNPILLSRTLIYGLNSEKNTLLGINTKLKIYDFMQFFGQFALDNVDNENTARNDYAFQIGIKHFDLFHNKINNQSLYLHGEYNYISPYIYSWSDPQQAYSHYNQPLAHPTGSGLKELLVTTAYRFKDISLTVRYTTTTNSLDTLNTNFGSDIFKPNEVQNGIVSHIGNTPGQGIKNELVHFNAELSFLINPATNMKLFAGVHFREIKNMFIEEKKIFYSFGIKTDINNFYYDF